VRKATTSTPCGLHSPGATRSWWKTASTWVGTDRLPLRTHDFSGNLSGVFLALSVASRESRRRLSDEASFAAWPHRSQRAQVDALLRPSTLLTEIRSNRRRRRHCSLAGHRGSTARSAAIFARRLLLQVNKQAGALRPRLCMYPRSRSRSRLWCRTDRREAIPGVVY